MDSWNDCWAALCACILNPRLSTPELGFYAIQDFSKVKNLRIEVSENPLEVLELPRGADADGIYPETIQSLRNEGYTWVEIAQILYPGRTMAEYSRIKHRVYARLRRYKGR